MKKVAYFGPEATFTHEAARKEFGADYEYVPQRLIPDIFFMVAQGEAHFGVVPVENSIEGVVTYTLDMFGWNGMEDIKICNEIYLSIVQNLLVNQNGPKTLEEIKVVYSHPQALAQCRHWLYDNMKHARLQESTSTATAAQIAAQDLTCAAIANRLAAEYYGLRVFQSNIQDTDFNQTRFLVIAKQATPYEAKRQDDGREVTALMLSIKDRVGALHAVT